MPSHQAAALQLCVKNVRVKSALFKCTFFCACLGKCVPGCGECVSAPRSNYIHETRKCKIWPMCAMRCGWCRFLFKKTHTFKCVFLKGAGKMLNVHFLLKIAHFSARRVCFFFDNAPQNNFNLIISAKFEKSRNYGLRPRLFFAFCEKNFKICGVQISAKREIGRKNSDGMAVKNVKNDVREGWFLKILYACRFAWPRV